MSIPSHLRYQSTFDDAVDGHLRFLSRDRRFMRKRRQNLIMGLIAVLAIGIAFPVGPIFKGFILATLAAVFLFDYEHWNPARFRKKLAKHLYFKGVKQSQNLVYEILDAGLKDENQKVHPWDELQEIESGPGYLALSFENGFTYLPDRAFDTWDLKNAWSESIQSLAPHAKFMIVKTPFGHRPSPTDLVLFAKA